MIRFNKTLLLLKSNKLKAILMSIVVCLLFFVNMNNIIVLAEENTNIHINKGNELLKKGDLNNAVIEYRKATHLDPNSFEAHMKFGEVLEIKNDYQGAKKEYEKAISINPESAEAHECMGFALLILRDYDGAVKECKEAIRLKPDWVHVYLLLGDVLESRSLTVPPFKTDEAILYYREAIRLEPDNARAHLQLGTALFGERDLKGAHEELNILKKLDKSKAKWLEDMLYPTNEDEQAPSEIIIE